MKENIRNPIIPGFYPDPSVCRVGRDFYLACSSFELYPGIPVFHSRDLVHWEQISNAMTAENGFHMERNCGVGGIMAPTIRYRDGLFYIIDTNYADGGNFIVTATDPRGPWSEPHRLPDVPGIDASLFFDDDGRAYVVGTGNVWDNGAGQLERGFWLAEYDLEHFRMRGEPVTIFNSALRIGSSPESPHIYHIGAYYYLLFAEGGTEHYHAVMAARSRELFGFYEGDPANPVMTHRHMGYAVSISNVGHADLVELPDGSWYAVLLASRPIGGYYKNIGRETFLCPVTWERGWPLFSPETGKLEWEYAAPASLPQESYPPEPTFDDFDSGTLPLYWTMWGTPPENTYRFHDSLASLRCVRQSPDDALRRMSGEDAPAADRFAAFLARRQKSLRTTAACSMRFHPENGERAGLAAVQSMNHQLQVERAIEDGRSVVRAVVVTCDYDTQPYLPGFEAHTLRSVVGSLPWDGDRIILQIIMDGQDWTVRCGETPETLRELARIDGRILNPEKVGCMCGTMLGMFATGSGTDSDNTADFDWFRLTEDALA